MFILRKHHITRKTKHMKNMTGTLVKIFILILIIFCLISAVTVSGTYRHSIGSLSDMSNLYINEIDDRLFRISRRLLLLLMEDGNNGQSVRELISVIQESGDLVKAYHTSNMLKDTFLQYRWEYGPEFVFFLFLDDSDQFLELTFDDKMLGAGSQQALIAGIRDSRQQTYSIKRKWEPLRSEERNFLYKAAYMDGIYLGCIVDAADILKTFTDIDLGKGGYVDLVFPDGICIRLLQNQSIQYMAGQDAESGSTLFDQILLTRKLDRASFTIRIFISSLQDQAMLTLVFMALICLAILFMGGYTWFMLYTRNYILKPIQGFIKNLEQYDDNGDTLWFHDHSIVELEQADARFRSMFHQIKKLKITLYEQALEKQQVEMDFLKLQIRPHFYLNSLNFIYSMIDMGMYDNAKKMTAATSDYLRYLFRNTSQTVGIQEEIHHCETYLEMVSLRYKNGFAYYIERDPEAMDARIFPFCVQIFIENAVEHALSLDKTVLVSLSVLAESVHEERYVNIYITDTGGGFATDILEKLQQGQSLEDENGNHIGIDNCLKRCRYLYGDKAKIHFSNNPLGGAIVDIHIPFRP